MECCKRLRSDRAVNWSHEFYGSSSKEVIPIGKSKKRVVNQKTCGSGGVDAVEVLKWSMLLSIQISPFCYHWSELFLQLLLVYVSANQLFTLICSNFHKRPNFITGTSHRRSATTSSWTEMSGSTRMNPHRFLVRRLCIQNELSSRLLNANRSPHPFHANSLPPSQSRQQLQNHLQEHESKFIVFGWL